MTGWIDALYKRILLAAHPVGSIYQSMDVTSPAELFGGRWEKIVGRFLYAVADGYAGAIGGEETVTLTVDQIPAHDHLEYIQFTAGEAYDKYAFQTYGSYDPAGLQAYSGKTSSVGGGQPHTNMPPYLAVYAWRRTA